MTTLQSADRVHFFDMVSAYARKGLTDWRNKSASIQSAIRQDLKNLIEENSTTIDAKFNDAKLGTDPGFGLLPAPKHTHKKQFHGAFFTLKVVKRAKDQHDVHFSFLLWKDVSSVGNTIGFRFEAPHPKTSHEYPHVQLCRAFRSPNIAMTTPTWIPDSYPAIPMLAHSPYDMFFSMVAAIHGHSIDPNTSPMLVVLNDSLQQDSKAAMIPDVVARISAQFDRMIR